MLGAAMVTGVSLFGIACAGPAAETAASEPDISQSPTMPSEPAQTDASQPDSGEQTPTTAAAASTSAPTSTALAAQAEPTLVPSTPEPADQPPPFPDVVVPLVAGGQIDIGSLEGQDTVLWFWAPW